MFWYKTNNSYFDGYKIESVKILNETEKTIQIIQNTPQDNERIYRVNKKSKYENYFRTKKEAKEYIENKLRSDIDKIKTRLDKAQENLKKFLAEE